MSDLAFAVFTRAVSYGFLLVIFAIGGATWLVGAVVLALLYWAAHRLLTGRWPEE